MKNSMRWLAVTGLFKSSTLRLSRNRAAHLLGLCVLENLHAVLSGNDTAAHGRSCVNILLESDAMIASGLPVTHA